VDVRGWGVLAQEDVHADEELNLIDVAVAGSGVFEANSRARWSAYSRYGWSVERLSSIDKSN
jgi:hypothetical protein